MNEKKKKATANVVEIRKLREREAHTKQVSDEGTYFVSVN